MRARRVAAALAVGVVVLGGVVVLVAYGAPSYWRAHLDVQH